LDFPDPTSSRSVTLVFRKGLKCSLLIVRLSHARLDVLVLARQQCPMCKQLPRENNLGPRTKG